MSLDNLQRAKNGLWAACRQINPDYRADEHNIPVLTAMAHWLVDAPHDTVIPGKGIALRGPVGTGKSDLMRALSRAMMIGGGQGFKVVGAIRIVKEYNRTKDENGRDIGGDAVILKYAEAGPLCIDDLGLEDPGKHYGKESNVIADILGLRYERWRMDPERFALHLTTNATNQALSERYDDRTMSRLNEMCVSLALGGSDRREDATPIPARRQELFAPAPVMPTEEDIEQERAKKQAQIDRIKKTLEEASRSMRVERAQAPARTQEDDLQEYADKLKDMDTEGLERMRQATEEGNTEMQAAPFLRLIDAELEQRKTAAA